MAIRDSNNFAKNLKNSFPVDAVVLLPLAGEAALIGGGR